MARVVPIRTETKRTAFINGEALQAIFRQALSVPAGSGIWLRAEMSDDGSTVLSMEVEWTEVGAPLDARTPA